MRLDASKVVRPVPLQEQEYRQGLYRLERHAIIPLKWCVLSVTFFLWMSVIGREITPAVFGLFLVYFLTNLALSYFFYMNRVPSGQIRPFTLVSYLLDVTFVTLLIYFDISTLGTQTNHNFYLLYFLLVMRGFALFKTIKETIFVNLLISVLYIITFYLRYTGFSFLFDAEFAVSLILIWLVIMMSWFIVMIITRQKMELLEVHERLLRAESLARVGELAAGVAHEINNPIGIIATTAAYLKRQLPADSEHIEEIDMIQSEAMRCKDIVQEMMTYANPRMTGTTLLELPSINDEVLAFVFPRNRDERFELVREYDDKPPLVEADPNLIKQALLNLYLNARQAIPEERRGVIVSRIKSGGSRRTVRLEVEDNGIGIKAVDLPLIFEPFFTRKPKGTGLGLAVTQRIVEKFGGEISVRPAAVEGTIFELEFPAAAR